MTTNNQSLPNKKLGENGNKIIPAAILVMTATTNALCQMLLVPLDCQFNVSLNGPFFLCCVFLFCLRYIYVSHVDRVPVHSFPSIRCFNVYLVNIISGTRSSLDMETQP